MCGSSIKLLIAFILIFLCLVPFLISETKSNYSVQAVECSLPPDIDGKLDDPFWQKAAVLSNFTQFEPAEGTSPSEKTEAYIGYDEKYLYFAVRCYDSDPERYPEKK
jgi:hypothetical protein